MTMSISPDNEQLLNNLVASGQYPNQDEALTAAIQLLNQSESAKDSSGRDILPPDQWLKEFDRITESRKGGNRRMDDSRESIYGDRGS